MMRRFDARWLVALAFGAGVSMTLGCERDASGLTEWTPADHDHQAEPRMRRTMANVAQKTNPHAAPTQKNQVIDVTWTKQCATCHGRRGKGDGPSSTMVKARDLSNAEFQATLSDEQIAKVIREGKDKMPAFNLPDSVIQGLVQHVRGMVKRRATGDDDAAELGLDEEVPDDVAHAAGQNAPAKAGAAAAPTPPASTPPPPTHGTADTTPQAPTQAPPAGATPTAAPSAAPPTVPPTGAPSAPVPSAPHP